MNSKLLLFVALLFITNCAKPQKSKIVQQKVGGPCEGCEAIFEYGTRSLNAIDTLPGFSSGKEKIMITGTVYKSNGKTPAKDVIIYAYQTNEKGIYPKQSNSKGWGRRHGYIRGWMKTNEDGKYTLYTFRPASYPNTSTEQHIHFTVKEPERNEYYIADINFDDDPKLSAKVRANKYPRSGNGIVKLFKKGNLFIAKRDIILGKNIPDYY